MKAGMHSDWKRLGLLSAAAIVSVLIPVLKQSIGSGHVKSVSLNSITIVDRIYDTGDISPVVYESAPRIIAINALDNHFSKSEKLFDRYYSSNIDYIYDLYSARCFSLPFVHRNPIVYSDGVPVSPSGLCITVPWCKKVDSLSVSEAVCSDGRTGPTFFSTHMHEPTYASFADVEQNIFVTVTILCIGRCKIVDADSNVVGEAWEMPDGSAMSITIPSAASSCEGLCTINGMVKSSKHHIDRACWMEGGERVTVTSARLSKDMIVISSTEVIGATDVGVVFWYHQPRFRESIVLAVCGTLLDPVPRLYGSMVFENVECTNRRFSMVLLTDKEPTMFGDHVDIITSPQSCQPDTMPPPYIFENRIANVDIDGMHRLVGDEYYLNVAASDSETVIRDIHNVPRAIVPMSGGCVLVDGWTPKPVYDAYTSYEPCETVSDECYDHVSNINIESPMVTMTNMPVSSGGHVFSVPWPPHSSVALDSGDKAIVGALNASSIDGLMLSEFCGSVLVYYARADHPIMETHFSPSGSVLKNSVGLLPNIWIDDSVVPEKLEDSCGMLSLWRLGGRVVASDVEPKAVISGGMACTSTRRCISMDDNQQYSLFVNDGLEGPVFYGGTITCVAQQ